ncbi:hypothetical protein BJY00DRAFT_310492 [Aspergillus carlsbadensis]|nr:hypothetical protein BJY00DRAFT_310492 [Aspergillus carlsbadensis]
MSCPSSDVARFLDFITAMLNSVGAARHAPTDLPHRAQMARKAIKAKPVVEGNRPAPSTANRKRKATKPLENQRRPRPSPPKGQKRVRKAVGKQGKPALPPPPAERIASKDPALATSVAQTKEAAASSEDDPASIIKYVNERHWEPDTAFFTGLGYRRPEFVAQAFSVNQDEDVEVSLCLVEWGRKVSEDGSLKAAFVVFQVEGLEYWIVFDNPYKDQTRTIAHQCMDLYVRDRHDDLAKLLFPIFSPFWFKAREKPCPDNMQSFLQRARTYLRLLPTGTLEPYPEFEHVPSIDWAECLRLWPSARIWSLSDVKRFARHNTTRLIYEVEIDGQSEPLVYKVMPSHDYLVRGAGML